MTVFDRYPARFAPPNTNQWEQMQATHLATLRLAYAIIYSPRSLDLLAEDVESAAKAAELLASAQEFLDGMALLANTAERLLLDERIRFDARSRKSLSLKFAVLDPRSPVARTVTNSGRLMALPRGGSKINIISSLQRGLSALVARAFSAAWIPANQ